MDKVHSERSKRLFCLLSVDGAKGNTSYLEIILFLFSQAEWLRRKFRMRIDQCLLICVIFLISKTFMIRDTLLYLNQNPWKKKKIDSII